MKGNILHTQKGFDIQSEWILVTAGCTYLKCNSIVDIGYYKYDGAPTRGMLAEFTNKHWKVVPDSRTS